MLEWKTPLKEIKIGTGRKLNDGTDIALLSIGTTGVFAQSAVNELKNDGISAAHYDMRFVKPLDEILLHEVFSKFDLVITIEDGCIMGGMGSAILEFMADNNYSSKVVRLGIPDAYIHHGTQKELYEEAAFDTKSIVKKAIELTNSKRINSINETKVS
jgi:1-deoxy-D-xylulose-5-phosphate synthase